MPPYLVGAKQPIDGSQSMHHGRSSLPVQAALLVSPAPTCFPTRHAATVTSHIETRSPIVRSAVYTEGPLAQAKIACNTLLLRGRYAFYEVMRWGVCRIALLFGSRS